MYLSRYLGLRRSAVLFDRCWDLFKVGLVTPLLAHPDLPRLLDDFNLAVDEP